MQENHVEMVRSRNGRDGVLSATVHNTDAPYVGGEMTEIEIVLNRRYPLVTNTSMAINMNDMFVRCMECGCTVLLGRSGCRIAGDRRAL